MGSMTAIALPSVRAIDLSIALTRLGTSWNEADHVTATVSLSRTMQSTTDRVALPVAALLDLIVLPAHPPESGLDLHGFPDQSVLTRSASEYGESSAEWRRRAGWCQFQLEFLLGNALQKAVRTGALPLQEGTILLRNRREFLKSISTLAAAGMRAADLAPSAPLPQAAAQAWEMLETDVPAFPTLRDTLWVDPAEVAAGASPQGRRVALLLRDALRAAFGPLADGARRTVVHHGFYFYTPPQWQLFQLLGSLHEVDQVFVVHDDGQNPAFKSWRQFFLENDWELPALEYVHTPYRPARCAAEFQSALTGRPIDSPRLAEQAQVLSYRNAAEFARHWTVSRDRGKEQPGTTFYGAGSKTLARLVRRIDRDQRSGQVNLSELPVGSFLLALHRCIHPTPGGPPKVRITSDRLLDIVSSGYLDVPGGADAPAVAALRRCIQFFDGCDRADQWANRAEALQRLIVDEVAPRGARDADLSDVERVKTAVGNDLRLLPWADLTIGEAKFVRDAIHAVVRLLEETVARETATFNEHLTTLRKRMERGLQDLPAADADEVRSKFASFGEIGDTPVHVDEVVAIVQMVLGRTPEFNAAGDDSEDDNTLVRPVRSLDSLGFMPSDRPLHLANLSERSFPSSVPQLGWPFRNDDITPAARVTHEISLGILKARSDSAGQGDLYLLHLALDGALNRDTLDPNEIPLTLSWIKDLNRELHDPSPLVTLITAPGGPDKRAANYVGGLSIRAWAGPANAPAVREVLKPISEDAPPDLPGALRRLDGRAAAIGHACSRRFALQWLVGDTAAYRSPHHHAMLYGNVLGMMARSGLSEHDARRVCDDLWRHFTAGERASSEANAVIYPGSNTADEWILTLISRWPPPYETAFRAAGNQRRGSPPTPPSPDQLAPPDLTFLPAGVNDSEICRHCPVRDRCLAAQHS